MFDDILTRLAGASSARIPPISFILFTATAALTAALALYKLLSSTRRAKLMPNVPFAGVDTVEGGSMEAARQRFLGEGAEMLAEGYRMTAGGFFYVPSPSVDRLMIPARYVEELKNAPDEQADFIGSFVEMFEGDYTTVGKRWNLHPRVVKYRLNPQLGTVLPPVEEEIPIAFSTVLPPCTHWTPIPIATAFKRIVAQASGRMIGGLTLSRNGEWLRTSLDFTTDSFAAAQRLKSYPKPLRPLAQWLVPEMAAVRRHVRVARKFIKPLLAARERAVADLGEKGKPVDLLQMLADGAEGRDREHNFLAYTALAVSFAAIHTSASVPAHLVYDLCARPEYIAPLREEVEEVLAETGAFTKAALAKLVKMDSFMKESQRFSPLVFMTFGRVIHKNLTLSDGVLIPAGTIIGVPSHAITHDPALYPDPDRFDGFRFLPTATYTSQVEQQPAPSEKPKPCATFTTTNAANLSWGYGKHACSGRFFASNEIKMVMAYLLLHYEFRFKDGPGVENRPRNVSFELQNSPDASVEILLRRRKEVGGVRFPGD